MKNQKLYAYLDIDGAYQLNKGNVEVAGQIFRDDPRVERSFKLEDGERYIHLMTLSQLLSVLQPLRENCFEKNGTGGIICEFDVPSAVLKEGRSGFVSYGQMRQGLYRPVAQEKVFLGSELRGCYTKNFVFDATRNLGMEQIRKLFQEQGGLKTYQGYQLGEDE